MTNLKPMKMRRTDYANDPYPYTVVSRVRDEKGMPVNGPHTLWESCSSEKMAMVYADHRSNLGYWVDVFLNIAYNTAHNIDD